jgi:hypothetical protein
MDRAAFYNHLRGTGSTLFGARLSSGVVTGIEGILDAFGAVGDGSDHTLAYALGTAYHETGRRMVPVREGFASTDSGARLAVEKLARKRGSKSAVARYAKPAGPYGHVYYGRGHVQLTWLDNYDASSADAGVDLVKNPDAMLDPEISARVLIRGLIDGRWNGSERKGVGAYLPGNPVSARRTVNGTDKALDIAGHYRGFLAAVQAAGGAKPAPTVAAAPITCAVPLPKPRPASVLGRLFG